MTSSVAINRAVRKDDVKFVMEDERFREGRGRGGEGSEKLIKKECDRVLLTYN